MSKYYVESRFNDRGLGYVCIVKADEDPEFDTRPYLEYEGYDRYVDGFDTYEEAKAFELEVKEA